jgi:tetratricopeptide (TPR) repeat protein
MTEDNKAYAYYLQAREYLDMPGPSANISYASKLFEAALAVDPGFARAMAGLCEVYWLEYEQDTLEASADKAEQSCRQARRLDPQLVDVQLALGRLYEGKGQHGKAIDAFRHALEIDPRSDQAYRGLSRVYLSRNQTGKALSTYAKAINLHPGYWLNYKELGNLHVQAGHYDEAIRWYREALELTPDNAEVHASLGVAMAMKGEFQQALAAYNHSIALKPTAAALTSMGDAYYHNGNYAQAFLMHQRAVEMAPGNFLGWLNLGNTRRQLYPHDKGTDQIYDKVVELARGSLVVNPRNASAWLAIALAKARLKQKDEAILSMRRGLELSAGNLAMRYQSAVVWSAMGDAERALDIIEELLADGISVRLIESDPALKGLAGTSQAHVLVDTTNIGDESRF